MADEEGQMDIRAWLDELEPGFAAKFVDAFDEVSEWMCCTRLARDWEGRSAMTSRGSYEAHTSQATNSPSPLSVPRSGWKMPPTSKTLMTRS